MSNNFLKEIIDHKCIEALDVYFTYYLEQSYEGGRRRSEHKKCLGLFSEYNSKIKYSKDYKMDDSEREEKIREKKIESISSKFRDLTDYRSLLTTEVKRQITEELLRSDIKKRIENLDDSEKEALSFVLSFISLKTQERSLALDKESVYSDLNIQFNVDKENERDNLIFDLTSDINHHKKWKYIFNLLYLDREIIHGYAIPICIGPFSDIGKPKYFLYAYDLGNTIVKSGLGYWEPRVTSSPNVHLELRIPKFLYDIAINYQSMLPEIQDFENRVKEIEKN